MITDIRPYFDIQIKAICPVLTAWDEDLFGNNDVTGSESENYYNLIIGENAPTRGGNFHADNIPVFLDIWAEVTNNRITDFDTLYDKALDIKNCIIAPINVYDPTYDFTDVECVSVEPIEDETSDNSFKIRLSFIVVKSFKF